MIDYSKQYFGTAPENANFICESWQLWSFSWNHKVRTNQHNLDEFHTFCLNLKWSFSLFNFSCTIFFRRNASPFFDRFTPFLNALRMPGRFLIFSNFTTYNLKYFRLKSRHARGSRKKEKWIISNPWKQTTDSLWFSFHLRIASKLAENCIA